jgi:hypothetical protein
MAGAIGKPWPLTWENVSGLGGVHATHRQCHVVSVPLGLSLHITIIDDSLS